MHLDKFKVLFSSSNEHNEIHTIKALYLPDCIGVGIDEVEKAVFHKL